MEELLAYNTISKRWYRYYISTSTRFDYTSADVTKTYTNNITQIDTSTDIYGYDADVKFGANYFNTLDIAMIPPEIRLSYALK